MAQGLRAFRKIQISNPEDTVGTAEAAAEIVYGTMTAYDYELTFEYPDEDRGSLARHMANEYETMRLAALSFESDLNFRHAAWWLSNSIRGNITPTQPDSANEPNAYLWTFEPGLTTANTPDITNGIDTFTIEYGDNIQAYETEYMVTSNLTITGESGGPIKTNWTAFGRQQTDTTFTGALTDQSIQRAPFQLAKFYVDTTGANLGTTQKTGVLKSFTWSFDTMFAPIWTSDGNLYFSQVAEDKKFVTLTLKYKWDSVFADAERTKWEGNTTFFPRIECLGATELDASQSNPPYLRLDGAFRYTSWPTPAVEEGEEVVEVTAESVYDSTWAKMISVTLLTDLSAYP